MFVRTFILILIIVNLIASNEKPKSNYNSSNVLATAHHTRYSPFSFGKGQYSRIQKNDLKDGEKFKIIHMEQNYNKYYVLDKYIFTSYQCFVS